jgi:hypothetical protein
MFSHIAPLGVPVVPGWAAHEIKGHPHWLLPFILIVLLSGALEVISHPLRVEQTIVHIPRSATPEELAIVRSDLDASLPGDISILPLKIAAAGALEAVALGLLLAGFGTGDRPRFAQLFALCIGLASIGILEGTAEVTYLWLLPFANSMPVLPWSALALAPAGQTYAVGLLLTSINLFTLWYVGALAWALTVLCSISKSKAVLIAIAVRAVTAGSTIALLHLLRNAYAFTI